MRHIDCTVGGDIALHVTWKEEAELRAEPGAPRMTEELHRRQTQCRAKLRQLLDIAAEGPERGVRRPVGSAAAQLVIGDHREAEGREPRMRRAQIFARQPRAAIDQQHDLAARRERRPVAIDPQAMTGHPNIADFTRSGFHGLLDYPFGHYFGYYTAVPRRGKRSSLGEDW